MNKKELTDIAIEKIQNDLEKAFFIFGYVYKMYPTAISAHNFGTFLSKYGHECSYKHYKDRACMLLRYAINIQPNYYSLKELGDLFFNSKKYKKAVVQYKAALSYQKKYPTYINLANCYYASGKYQDAVKTIESLINEFELPFETETYALVLQGFSLIQLDNNEDAKKIFATLSYRIDDHLNDHTRDILQLAFFCREYSYILNNYKSILNHWIFDIQIFQIIYQSYLQNSKDELSGFVDYYSKLVNNFYKENTDFDQSGKEKMLQTIQSGPYTPELVFVPQFYWQVDFI